jgi:hypothetical protein
MYTYVYITKLKTTAMIRLKNCIPLNKGPGFLHSYTGNDEMKNKEDILMSAVQTPHPTPSITVAQLCICLMYYAS